jgi:1-deoxy-D-xylulose-5-phosphate reductoisomerase
VKRLAVLGSTGSIGTQTLDVVRRFPDRFRVTALAAGRNLDLLAQQVKEFRPERVTVADPADLARLRGALGTPAPELSADIADAARADADLVVGALVGSLGLRPVLAALERGTDVALANKEVLVMAGELVLRSARAHGATLLPLDSEHVALHQCLAGHPREGVRRLILTASGGPFRGADPDQLAHATPERALAHPNWEMGPKITIDSATLMNKGFEVIEARWLFELPPELIDVIVHPESVIHSLVEFCDGSWLAQLAIPDMRVPIAYVLGLPDRLPLPELAPLDLVAAGALHFEAPDPARFPALRLAREALAAGGAAPCVLNAANEVGVRAFLERRIRFLELPALVEAALAELSGRRADTLDEILEADRAARSFARRWIEGREGRDGRESRERHA